MVRRRGLLSCLLLAVTAVACSSETATSPEQQSSISSITTTCTADPVQIEALINQVFAAGSLNRNSALGKWANVEKKVNMDASQLRIAQQRVIDLIDFIKNKRTQGQIVADDATVTALFNQLLCFVGLGGDVEDPDDVWVVHVGDPIVTFVTADGQSGIQFPGNAVSENTIVSANRVDESFLHTPLDKYPFVYDWTLVPSQTLLAGKLATVGVCPNPAAFADVPSTELQDLLDRLVLGHQRSATAFDALARVPIPAAMVLTCGDITTTTASRGFAARMLASIANWVLPTPAMAASRRAGGGVGGNTSEFSPFGPVDPELRVGGVGGNTSEFSRMDPEPLAASSLASPLDGTVGTQRTTGFLPNVTITTRRGTPIPGVGVTFGAEPPATQTPVGDASICGADTQTDATGFATVRCLAFGTTVNIPIAYTKVRATFTVPASLTAGSDDVIIFEPAFQTWLVESYGATALAITSPPAGRTGANGYPASSPITVTVEVRSALGDIVPIATMPVLINLNKNSFATGTVTSKNAVAGVATFSVAVPTAANGYRIIARATLANGLKLAESPLFDVIP